MAWFADELGESVQLLRITSATGMFDGEVELDIQGVRVTSKVIAVGVQ